MNASEASRKMFQIELSRAEIFWKILYFSQNFSKLRSDYLFSFQKRTIYLFPAFSRSEYLFPKSASPPPPSESNGPPLTKQSLRTLTQRYANHYRNSGPTLGQRNFENVPTVDQRYANMFSHYDDNVSNVGPTYACCLVIPYIFSYIEYPMVLFQFTSIDSDECMSLKF